MSEVGFKARKIYSCQYPVARYPLNSYNKNLSKNKTSLSVRVFLLLHILEVKKKTAFKSTSFKYGSVMLQQQILTKNMLLFPIKMCKNLTKSYPLSTLSYLLNFSRNLCSRIVFSIQSKPTSWSSLELTRRSK